MTDGSMNLSLWYEEYWSATVTNLLEMKEWNEVNPANEKLKFGRGVLYLEMNKYKDRKIDKCLSPSNRYRTRLIYIYYL